MKTIFTAIFALLAILFMGWLGYTTICAATDLVPPGEYAGLTKLGITIALICIFGGIFVGVGIVFTALVSVVAATLADFVESFFKRVKRHLPRYTVKVGRKYAVKSTQRDTKPFIFTVTAITKDDDSRVPQVTYLSDRPFWGDTKHQTNLSIVQSYLMRGEWKRIR